MKYIFETRLKMAMRDKSISQSDLATGLGLTRQAVNSYTNGRTKPDAEMLFKIADYIGVSADYLLGLSDTPSLHPDIQASAKLTGLSGDAVEALATLNAEAGNDFEFYRVLNAICDSLMSNGKTISSIAGTELGFYTAARQGVLASIANYIELSLSNPVGERYGVIQLRNGQSVIIDSYEYVRKSVEDNLLTSIRGLSEYYGKDRATNK